MQSIDFCINRGWFRSNSANSELACYRDSEPRGEGLFNSPGRFLNERRENAKGRPLRDGLSIVSQ
jgi:hypothetical protein